jgi:hypothetical protein
MSNHVMSFARSTAAQCKLYCRNYYYAFDTLHRTDAKFGFPIATASVLNGLDTVIEDLAC